MALATTALRATRVLSALARSPTPASQPGTSNSPVTILEVERKFRRLAVPTLTNLAPRGPAFQSVRALPTRRIHDVYYDTPRRALSAAGAWVRRRDGAWEAKLRQGGDFVNSRFEEVAGEEAVARRVASVLGSANISIVGARPGADSMDSDSGGRHRGPAGRGGVQEVPAVGGMEELGLRTLAEFVTTREAWVVDGEFRVVRDRMDFGHEVGEVELQVEVREGLGDEEKVALMEEMDRRVEAFMRRYAWAWEREGAVGKLTAYFDMVEGGKRA